MGYLAKFSSLARREKIFFCEACILLLLSNICIKAIAFRHLDRFLRTRWNHGQTALSHEQEIRLIQRSISRAANVSPWPSLCLCRSMAEFIMLRRRGIQAELFAGAKFSGSFSLKAHAWVETGLVNENSSENSDFAIVIRIV